MTNLCWPVYDIEVPTAVIILPARVLSILPYSFIKLPISFSSIAKAANKNQVAWIVTDEKMSSELIFPVTYCSNYFDND